MSSAETRAQAERDDYNVRHYAFHIYFLYCTVLYLAVAAVMLYDPTLMLCTEEAPWGVAPVASTQGPASAVTYYGYSGALDEGGLYCGRQSAGLMLTMGLLTLLAWRSKSGPVRDLIIKVHFAHHASSLLVDWYSEYQGFLSKSWQHGLFTPHPFFTGLILFLWSTDKRRNLAAEERENQGNK